MRFSILFLSSAFVWLIILVIFIFPMSVSFILLLVVYLSISNSSSNVSKYLLCPHFSVTIICILCILCFLFFCYDICFCIRPKRKFHAIYLIIFMYNGSAYKVHIIYNLQALTSLVFIFHFHACGLDWKMFL